AGLQLIIEDRVLTIVDLAVLPHRGLRNIFRANHVGGLLEELVHRLTRLLKSFHPRRSRSRIGGRRRGRSGRFCNRSLAVRGGAAENEGNENGQGRPFPDSSELRRVL